MTNVAVVLLFVFVRLFIPIAILFSLGEILRRRTEKVHCKRGA